MARLVGARVSRRTNATAVAVATIAAASIACRMFCMEPKPSTVSGLVRFMDFVLQGIQNLAPMQSLQVVLQPSQRYADDVAMMEPRADVGVPGKAQPDAMQAVDVFRPKPRRMRPQIHIDRRAVRIGDFERKRLARFGQLFPGEPDAAGKFL